MPSKSSVSKLTLSKAKKRAWTAFSKYIRLRDSLDTTGTPDQCMCVTCGKVYPNGHVGSIQAGHFIPGRHSAILFREDNCFGQCYNCNITLKGNNGAYIRYMKDRFGQEKIDELLELDRQTRKYTVPELLELEQTYKNKTKLLG